MNIIMINSELTRYRAREQHEMIQDVIGLTGVTQHQAIMRLKSANWSISATLSGFLKQDSQDCIEPQNIEIEQLFHNFSEPLHHYQVINDVVFSGFLRQYFQLNEQSVVVGHILINIMKVKKFNAIRKSNLYRLFAYLGTQHLSDIHRFLPALEKEILLDRELMRKMYEQLFPFYLNSHKATLSLQEAVSLWLIYLKPVFIFYEQFFLFLKTIPRRRVQLDLWKMVYAFAVYANPQNIVQIKNVQAWPVLIDEFVEYLFR